jgi:magnesium chelatase subunit D
VGGCGNAGPGIDGRFKRRDALHPYRRKKKVVFDADELICVADITLLENPLFGGRHGRSHIVQVSGRSGRYIRAGRVRDDERHYDLALDATVRSALLRRFGTVAPPTRLEICHADLRKKLYLHPRRTLIVFVVDSSDSMGDDGTYARIKAAKGAVLATLGHAYRKRHRVAMVVFREETATVVLPPTTSLALAQRRLRTLPTGGATPFADGLMLAWRLIRTERRKESECRPMLVILSDGEANVAHDPERNPTEVMAELMAIAARIGADSIPSLCIDTRPLRSPAPQMRELAAALGGSYRHISRLSNSTMVQTVVGL